MEELTKEQQVAVWKSRLDGEYELLKSLQDKVSAAWAIYENVAGLGSECSEPAAKQLKNRVDELWGMEKHIWHIERHIENLGGILYRRETRGDHKNGG